ncbi:cytochrome c-type biogenesis protein CcsB [Andreprevotia lacus DSM 23236]|jgi:cytochrome c-type biogenesis protein CcsB|uniref:Cytochrome c-type biogenesis protein CcsB n=1 Tax=Andreprevotia lacus DSM 23236 TaxID=1121001 RepID=A0A1W1XSK9_9NEIS|nr:c-type cytochrome biogenesis protein CcsB [Andreprevotia lacus]SMC26950.1 cytochrome c-type biogenesis protein CcsB [Andreprevotia lacus DSM 23236]
MTAALSLRQRSPLDFVFALLALLAGGFAFSRYGHYMDYYEQGILLGATLTLIGFGWFWPAMRVFLPVSAVIALCAIGLYQGDLARGQTAFWLKYMLASQSLVMWMCVCFFLATGMFWLGLLRRSETALSIGVGLTWAATTAALSSALVRWYESYLIGADVGHIPVSNLYEVFVLFCLITALMYLYYQARFKARSTGAFILLVIAAAVGFILWYTFDRQAHEIQPLIPALQSWWMKIHVPANFIGYGAFGLSAMLGVAWLLAVPAERQNTQIRNALYAAAAGIALAGIVLYMQADAWFPELGSGAGFITGAALCVAACVIVHLQRGLLSGLLPAPDTLGEIMYKAISVGFLFFTIATILGAAWAAEAWGGYWSWDPKETWALIVWLNYAAWLHIRLVKGWRGAVLAWWAVAGLLVTTFAFLGVNMFLSGLHAYGKL